MKILKRLFFFILIILMGVAIFIAVQPSQFEVSRSIIIKAPIATVFNYLNDFKTGKEWNTWILKDPKIVLHFSEITKGENASYRWESKKSGNGSLKNVKVVKNTSIDQKMTFGKSVSDVQFNFMSTENNETKVTWKIKGKLDFFFKAFSLVYGGMDKMIGTEYEESLKNIQTKVTEKLNASSFEFQGTTEHGGGFYLYLPIKSDNAEEFSTFWKEGFDNLKKFATKNNITIIGAPFTIFDLVNETEINGKVALPIGEKVSPKSILPIGCDYQPKQTVLKAVHIGSYQLLKNSWDKLNSYIINQNLKVLGSSFEVYTIYFDITEDPTMWQTDLYIPVQEQ